MWILSPTISMGLKFQSTLAGWFWLRVSHEVAVKVGTEARGRERGRIESIPSMERAGDSRDAL